MPRPRQFNPDTAIEAAMTLFWKQGYDAVSFDALVAETGASRKGLYALWPDKQSLLVAALQRYRALVGEELLDNLEQGDSGLEALKSFWDRFEEGARDPGWSGCLVVRTAADRIGAEPAVAAEVGAFLDRLAAAFEQALWRAAARGEIDLSVAPDLRARQAYSVALACSSIGIFEGFTSRVGQLIEAGRESCGIRSGLPDRRLVRRRPPRK